MRMGRGCILKYMHTYVCMYIYICMVYINMCIYIYMYIQICFLISRGYGLQAILEEACQTKTQIPKPPGPPSIPQLPLNKSPSTYDKALRPQLNGNRGC